jgi:hypothetical protein
MMNSMFGRLAVELLFCPNESSGAMADVIPAAAKVFVKSLLVKFIQVLLYKA